MSARTTSGKLVWLLVVALGGCTTTWSLRSDLEDSRSTTSAGSLRAALGEGGTALEGAAPLAATEPSEAQPPPTAEHDLEPKSLAFLNIELDEAAWAEAAAEGWTPGGAMTQKAALTVYLSRSRALRAAWKRMNARANRHSQALYLRRLVEQFEGFARRPDARPSQYPLPTAQGLQGKAVEADIKLAREQFRAKTLDLVTTFVSTFHSARFQRRSASILRKNVTLSRRFAKVVQSRYASGQARKADLLKAEMRLAEMVVRQRTAVEAAAAAEQKLGALLNMSTAIKAGTPESLPKAPALEAALKNVEHAPDLMIAQLRWERAQSTLELMERKVQPDLSEGLSERLGIPAQARFPGKYVVAGPFTEELRDRVAAQSLALEQAKTSVPAASEKAWADLSDAARTARLYRRINVPKADQALKAAESEYRVGRTTYLYLDDIQRLWLRVSLAAAAVDRKAHVAAARLNRVLGPHTHHEPQSSHPGQK